MHPEQADTSQASMGEPMASPQEPASLTILVENSKNGTRLALAQQTGIKSLQSLAEPIVTYRFVGCSSSCLAVVVVC